MDILDFPGKAHYCSGRTRYVVDFSYCLCPGGYSQPLFCASSPCYAIIISTRTCHPTDIIALLTPSPASNPSQA
ncbi:hypothetical protein G7K_3272-t1 [Saitoella complicata NRRL Y-17804]|uniref:Uncharacterized protein n=1 Tax=Saitoella complicata (strain BCRC 22490 / CBS 7301 / JCM 7358 / NBRC 10748 / NRRL Y-17804) TaxID=698492 RepID=A0A0E9NGZ4_SAICN|nr:hypothetical protein G7K_3272-t1 [Saitoella complicata NRRL Y-17804]